jgi:two-component system, NarL family, sensor kinase
MVSLIISITFILLLLTCFLMSFLFIYQKKQISYFETIEKLRHDYEKNLLSTQLEMQEQTFQHISREIHDNINLSLTLAKLNLNTFDWNHPDKAKIKIYSTLQQISKAIADLSDLSKGMNTEIIINQGLIEVLKKETNRLRELNLFELDYVITGNPVFLDSQKELVIFRIIQEALNNIIKHARATSVKLNLEYNFDHINVLIADNGRGFCKEGIEQNKNKESNAGLNNMQKRAALFNGRTIIDSTPDSGTNIYVTIPY